MLWRITIILRALSRSETTSPLRSVYDGIVTRLPFTEHVAVAHELAGLVAARREPGAEHDVVDAQLEQAQQVLTGDAGLLVRLVVDQLELLLEQAVDAARLLLLAQLEAGTRSRGCDRGRACPAGTDGARSGSASSRTSCP